MKKTLKVVGITFGCLIVIMIVAMVFMVKKIENSVKPEDIIVTNVDLSQIADGSYSGQFEAFPVIVAVQVDVKDHVITSIAIKKHQNGKGKAAEAIIGSIIAQQTLEVDAISGATHSSTVIRKAVEVALTGQK